MHTVNSNKKGASPVKTGIYTVNSAYLMIFFMIFLFKHNRNSLCIAIGLEDKMKWKLHAVNELSCKRVKCKQRYYY